MNVNPWNGVQVMRQRAADGPLMMLNLLKFKPGGEQRYLEGYASVALPMIERLGGRILYAGRLAERAHDDDAPEWDALILVEDPNRQAFIDMVNDPAYRAAHVHRSEAVERALLRGSRRIRPDRPLPSRRWRRLFHRSRKGASPLEGKLCAGQEVALVGAGNSAGQAVVYLASQVAKVWLLARGSTLEASMSRYRWRPVATAFSR